MISTLIVLVAVLTLSLFVMHIPQELIKHFVHFFVVKSLPIFEILMTRSTLTSILVIALSTKVKFGISNVDFY